MTAFLDTWDDAATRASATLPHNVVEAARRSWFDTLAATAAGVRDACTRAAFAATEAPDEAALTSADAALVLGAASHALDYDDVCMLATCHASAPPVAALLGLVPLLQRERPDVTMHELLAAYALGTETTLRLGEWLGFRHYALGFHATATLGTVGVAAATAHVLRLPRATCHHALAIAASSACGLRANFGTDTKPLHVGFAAAAGLRAALLARAGARASDDVWGPSGFWLAFNGDAPVVPLPWRPGQAFALVDPGFEHKRFPSCYLTHRLIAGVLKIRARRPQGVDEAVHIDIEMPRNGTAPLKHPQASTGLEAKFSGPYCAAAAWVDGQVALASFADRAVQRPALREQMARVMLRERSTEGESLDTAPVRVTVRGEGWTEHETVDWAPGSPADPFTRDELRAKWADCAVHGGLPANDAAALRLLDAPPDTRALPLLLPLRVRLLEAAAAGSVR